MYEAPGGEQGQKGTEKKAACVRSELSGGAWSQRISPWKLRVSGTMLASQRWVK